MADLEKEIKKEEKQIRKFFAKKENIWMSIAIILAFGLIVSLILPLGLFKNKAGDTLVNFLNTNVVQGGGVALKSVEDKGSLYLVNVIYQSQEIPVYLTKDGRYFIQGVTELTAKTSSSSSSGNQPAVDVPKTDKPKVDLYIFSYCPYGTQTEKGLVPVYNLLKNKADINIVVIGAMHGEYEKIESLRQICIEKLYGKDVFMSYLDKFNTNAAVGACRGSASCVDPLINTIFSSLNVDVTKVNSCMTTDAPALYSAQEAQASSLGISGSPTLVINGVQVQSGRSPAGLLTSICSGFKTKPSECSQTLDSATPSAGFGGSSSSAASTGAQC
jgi:hypothetical protein